MALALPHSIFFHIPKTGGMWAREAIKNAGIPAVEVGGSPDFVVNYHNTFRQVDSQAKFTFTFVRHPLTWYPSFWCYRMLTGWQTTGLADQFMSLSFEKFVWNVVRNDPGHLSTRYERNTGPGVLDFVGKMENLASDLVKALRLAGEEFDEERLLSTPSQNVSPLQPVYSSRLRKAVLETERRTLERFDYHF